MSLIEDAKALICPRDIAENCFYCGADVPDDPHKPDCCWQATMPRIVTALEAAQAVVWEDCCRLACCNGGLHDDECPIPALRRALAGGQ